MSETIDHASAKHTAEDFVRNCAGRCTEHVCELRSHHLARAYLAQAFALSVEKHTGELLIIEMRLADERVAEIKGELALASASKRSAESGEQRALARVAELEAERDEARRFADATALEAGERNVELRERIRELEAELARLRVELGYALASERQMRGYLNEQTIRANKQEARAFGAEARAERYAAALRRAGEEGSHWLGCAIVRKASCNCWRADVIGALRDDGAPVDWAKCIHGLALEGCKPACVVHAFTGGVCVTCGAAE